MSSQQSQVAINNYGSPVIAENEHNLSIQVTDAYGNVAMGLRTEPREVSLTSSPDSSSSLSIEIIDNQPRILKINNMGESATDPNQPHPILG